MGELRGRAAWRERVHTIVFEADTPAGRAFDVALVVLILAAVLCVRLTAMYLVEGPEHGFTSIPVSMYWAVVTMTTVGYGDISPRTPLGQLLASVLMVLGYSLIIVPTGIVSAELSQRVRPVSTQACPECSREGHDAGAGLGDLAGVSRRAADGR